MSAARCVFRTICLLAGYFTIFTSIETQALYDRAMRGRTQENPPGRNTDTGPNVLRQIPGSDTRN